MDGTMCRKNFCFDFHKATAFLACPCGFEEPIAIIANAGPLPPPVF